MSSKTLTFHKDHFYGSGNQIFFCYKRTPKTIALIEVNVKNRNTTNYELELKLYENKANNLAFNIRRMVKVQIEACALYNNKPSTEENQIYYETATIATSPFKFNKITIDPKPNQDLKDDLMSIVLSDNHFFYQTLNSLYIQINKIVLPKKYLEMDKKWRYPLKKYN